MALNMKNNSMTALYSAAHFLVDMSCAFLMMRYAFNGTPENILLYNFCAFALQMPIGVLLDRFGREHKTAASGCLVIGLAFPLSFLGLFTLSSVCAGIGNALFHSGGGVYVLEKYQRSGALGVFVSTGAAGLWLGTVQGTGETLLPVVPIASMILSAVCIFLFSRLLGLDDEQKSAEKSGSEINISKALKAAAALFTAVVIIRSFGGFAVDMSWKTTSAASLGAVLAAVSGKASGGFLADIIGKKKAAAISMTAAALMFIFSDNIVFGIAAVFLFNMSMPMTLRAAADIFENARGFAFGLLTFALFLGYLPVYSLGNIDMSRFIMALLCIASAAAMLTGFSLMDKDAKEKGAA